MKHFFSYLEESICKRWSEHALANYRGKAYTYGEVATTVEKLHVIFEAAGVQKGEKMAICAKNSASWAISFLASASYETVTVPILVDFHPDSINSLVDHSESIVLFTDPDIFPKLDVSKMPQLHAVVSVADFSLLWSNDEKYMEAFAKADELFAAKWPSGFTAKDVNYPKDNAKKLAIINYTSGTTSAPKGVMLRYECVSANVDFALREIPIYDGDKIVSMLPMAHMYGMMFEFIYPFCGGACVTYFGKTPTPALLLAAMKEVKPYIIITVPLVLEKVFKSKVLPVLNKPVMKVLTKIPGVNNIIFGKIRNTLLEAFGGNLRTMVMGGAALNPEVEAWFKKFKLPYTVGYGMTEAAPLMAYSNWTEFVPKSCGKAMTYTHVRIDSEDPQNVVGQIQAKGVNLMSGYYKNPEATNAAFTEDGWMNTGDLGVIDAAGNIFIRGRSKNMILSSNGQNIYPEEIEAVCNNQPYVIESVVVDRSGKLVALLYLDNEKLKADGLEGDALARQLEQIRSDINASMPAYSKVAKIEPVSVPFEKTPKMSIKRFLYR